MTRLAGRLWKSPWKLLLGFMDKSIKFMGFCNILKQGKESGRILWGCVEMIRDRAIQKRITGKVLAMAMTAFMASFFVPLGVEAAENLTWGHEQDLSGLDTGNLVLEKGKWQIEGGGPSGSCGETCTGHKITGTNSGTYGIQVKSGTHRILLDNAIIDTAKNPSADAKKRISALNLESEGKAVVDLYLSGTNQLISPDGKAGIYAPGSTELTIKSLTDDQTDILVAKAGSGGAGIGGEGYTGNGARSGRITIDGGTIVALGGNLGTGIGGCDQGSATIIINGGYVTAKGGDGIESDVEINTKGAAGIGGAGNSTITINNGNVTAIGGEDYGDKNHAVGFLGTNLTSSSGGKTVIKSDGFSDNLLTNNFNGLVWNINRNEDDKITDSGGNIIDMDPQDISTLKDLGQKVVHGNTCDVYGKAIMPADFPNDFGEGDTLNIREYASFLVPVNGPMLYNSGTIMGKGTLINPHKVKHIGGSLATDTLTLRLAFNPEEDVEIHDDLMYKGEAFSEKDIFTQSDKRTEDGVEYYVDDTGMTYKFQKKNGKEYDDIGKNEVENAGDYRIVFTYGGDYPMDFTVQRRPLNDKNVKVEPLPSIDYKGRAIKSGDFLAKDVIVKYKGEPLTPVKDYNWAPEGEPKNVGTATLIITSGNAAGNFCGSCDALFEIKKVSIENAKFTLVGEDSKIYYDGHKHQLLVDSDSVSLIVDDEDLKPKKDEDYEVKYSTSDFINAGEITVQLNTDRSKNFTGTCEKKYTIHPRQIKVQTITAADRLYDGTGKVAITDIKVDLSKEGADNSNAEGINGILPGDFDKIRLPKEIVGYITKKDRDSGKYLPANVGSYDTVFLEENMTLDGDDNKGKCYTLMGTYSTKNLNVSTDPDKPDEKTGPWALTEEVKIDRGKAPSVKLSAVQEEDGGKFKVSLAMNPATELDFIDPTSIIHYYYAPEGTAEPEKDAEGWKFTPYGEIICSDDNFLPRSKWRFWAYLEGTDNIAESNIDSYLVEFDRLTQTDKPSSCTLEAIPDGDTYKLVVKPEQTPTEDRPKGLYLYSFDPEGKPETYTYLDYMEGAEPNTQYTAWIKYAESDLYKESEEGVSATITTSPLDVMQPEISSNGNTIKDKGEISFKGSTDVSISYPGKLKMKIFYTTDGTTPTASSEEYTDKMFTVDKDTQVKAIAIKEGVATSAVTTVDFKKTGEVDNDDPNNQQNANTNEIIPIVKALDENTIKASPLGSTEDFNTMDAVTSQMASKVLLKRGYSNSQMIYCDLTIQIKRDNGQYTDATEEDFAKAGSSGIRVGLTFDALRGLGLPSNVSGTTHNFVVSHMFSTDIPRLQVTAGQTEEPVVSKTADGNGIAFSVTGTSPLAIAWADVANSDANPTEDPAQDPTQDPAQDPTQDPTQDPDQNPNQSDDGTGNTNPDGTTSNTDAAAQGVSNDGAGALSSIMPKTGDPLSFVPWIAAAVVSIGVIGGLMKKKAGNKTAKKKKPTKTMKNTTQKTMKKK